MYWLLLPMEANTQRHLNDVTGLPGNYWIRLWTSLQRVLSGLRSPRV
jgi:hypothetical protein